MDQMEQIKDEIMTTVIAAAGFRVKPGELRGAVSGRIRVSNLTVQQAINDLVAEGYLTYAYRDGNSYLEIPADEIQLAATHPIKVAYDSYGEPWIVTTL